MELSKRLYSFFVMSIFSHNKYNIQYNKLSWNMQLWGKTSAPKFSINI